MDPGNKSGNLNLSGLEKDILLFTQSLTSFKELAARYNFRIEPFSEASLQRFTTFPEVIRAHIIGNFNNYLDFLIESSKEDLSGLRDDRFLVGRFLKKMNLIHDDRLLDQITEGDIIEVYSKEIIQIFRNLNFMDVCSYTLLDLLTHQPYDLYDRSLQVVDKLKTIAMELETRPFNLQPMNLSNLIPVHALQEKFSEHRLSAMVTFKTAYPLYSWPQNYFGVLVIQEGKLIKDPPKDFNFI